jgi:mRNA-degrading endonuclease RelE of RelBE toxin-antitoxin system
VYAGWSGYIITMMYEVRIKRKLERALHKLPADVQKLLYLLLADLKADGPIQKSWSNFSSLGKDQYHCHLNYRYVASWTCRKDEIVIEVYYAGSREKAPY